MWEGAYVGRTLSAEELAAEGAAGMKEQEGALQEVFNMLCSIKARDGTKLMNRPDLHRFFKDLEQVDQSRSHRVSSVKLDKLYEEAIELQRDLRGQSKGLTFMSFKVLLNNAIKVLGLGWFGLVELAVGRNDSTSASGDQVTTSAFDSHATSNR